MFLRHAAVIACGNEEDWLISRSIEDHGTYYLNLFVCNPWRLGLWAWTMSSWLIHILETGELLRLLDFFLRAGPFFREFRHSAQQGPSRSMDFRQFAGVGANQLRARNSRGNNGQDPELGTTAILPGVRSREQGLYTGSVYPAFTGLQVCIQLFCTPHHAFLQCQLYILRCLLRDRDSVSPPPRTARASFEVRLFPPPSSDELKVVE